MAQGQPVFYSWKYEDAPSAAPAAAATAAAARPRCCSACGKAFDGAAVTLAGRCAKCGVARYCSRDCQVAHWKDGHKFGCDRYKLLGSDQQLAGAAATREVVERLAASVRLYICPFAVQNHDALNAAAAGAGGRRGFVFIQSSSELAALALPAPVDCWGAPLPTTRTLVMHFATLDEFAAEKGGISAGRAALQAAGGALAAAVAAHDHASEVVVLCHFGSAAAPYTAVVVAPLLQMSICRALASDYAGKDSLQLDLDDL